ncbi:conserved protein of unknown function [Rhodovastum atsumiense]|uniref:DUF2478 domain-containing protein n=1 Tax=Rhodovastum atsumiense TaxID=504468 RepID=A0A5M6IZ60_9PROT|nr:DUF2478 domain-containing protein [Rhodovastum atsumiense]KAA5613636.1 DUF2478 domain-containing protein [Rhodovastum atsumiense]CAH2599541.1 conserved protein of unknown function [Rhodovastum atsumiense]
MSEDAKAGANAPGRVAAVVFSASDDVDAVLHAAVAALRGQGLRVGGLLQRLGAEIRPRKHEMLLEVLETGESIRLDAPRGTQTRACTLDTDALARAAMSLRAALQGRPDVLVVSRFGKQEATGSGMRDEIAEAVLSDIAVLVAVSDALLADWEAFLGGGGCVLPADGDAILQWAKSAVAPAHVPEGCSPV